MASGDIAWDSLSGCLPTWIVMILIVLLDNGLKLAATESALAIDIDYNQQMRVGGWGSIISAFLAGAPVYNQCKFAVLNYGMTHTTERKLPAITVALFTGALFFSGVPLIDYLPRFVLSGLLLYSAIAFLYENLWDARKKFDKLNFRSVWGVFIINVVTGEYLPQYGLLISMVAGMLWGLFTFVVQFARHTSNHSYTAISGEGHCSSAIRSAAQETKLGILGVWFSILKCSSSYVFFGTASLLYKKTKDHVTDNRKLPKCQRTKLLIFDITEVTAMDATAADVFLKIYRLCTKAEIELVWACPRQTVQYQLTRAGIPLKANGQAHVFKTLDKAEKFVEDKLLANVHRLAEKWLIDKACRAVYNRALLHDALTCSHSNHDGIGPSQLLKWSRRQFVRKGECILTEGGDDDGLYMLCAAQCLDLSTS
jgi:SulP family sulfate permease